MKKVPAVLGLVVLALLLYGLWWFGVNDPAPLAGEVANKLRAADATLYIVSDDPASQLQMNQFGGFASQVPVVDCKEQTAVCDTLQLEEIPTLVIGAVGLEVAGAQSPEEIKALLIKLNLW